MYRLQYECWNLRQGQIKHSVGINIPQKCTRIRILKITLYFLKIFVAIAAGYGVPDQS